jgi:hypothetical protein
MLDRDQFKEMREWSFRRHQEWKQRLRRSDLLAQGKWTTLWPDLTISEDEALVENVYIEALEDKAASAASTSPFVEVAPTRGTRKDQAERNAQQRRRAFVSFMRESDLFGKQVAWAYDWLQAGVMVGMPWLDWRTNSKQPYIVRFDPRHYYPISHDSRGNVTSAMVVKYRRLTDLEHDYGVKAEALANYRQWADRNDSNDDIIEEIWYADENVWGLALVANSQPMPSFFRYVNPLHSATTEGPFMDWIIEPTAHRLSRCPIVERQRETPDGEYRGALDPMGPNLRVAHNLMARIIEDVESQIGAPKIVEGVENLSDWGPGAILRGDGTGQAKIVQDRQPMNFEAIQHVKQQVESARNVGSFPQQRSGDFGASIASAKATVSVMGSYNTQLAWNQRDLAAFYRELLARTAEFDEKWCSGGSKEITGWDEGELFTDKYDPGTFWKGDYRCDVGFTRVGLDEQQHLTRLAMARQIPGGISGRTFLRKSGLVDNPLGEERENAIEMSAQALQAFMFQQASAGNLDPLIKFTQKIDGDDATVRSAAMETIKEMMAVPTEGPAAQGGQGGSPDAIAMQRSLEQGGIPGNAEQLPALGADTLALLPRGAARGAAEAAPGGSGP